VFRFPNSVKLSEMRRRGDRSGSNSESGLSEFEEESRKLSKIERGSWIGRKRVESIGQAGEATVMKGDEVVCEVKREK